MQLAKRQHEEFCHAIVAGSTLTEAAKCAGFAETNAHNSGSRLAKQPHIAQRIAELKAARAQEPPEPISRGYVVSQTILIHRRALVAKQYSVNLACMQFLAKLGGYIVDRKETYRQSVDLRVSTSADISAAISAASSALPENMRQELLESAPELAEACTLE